MYSVDSILAICAAVVATAEAILIPVNNPVGSGVFAKMFITAAAPFIVAC
jgi:hypothetical protein